MRIILRGLSSSWQHAVVLAPPPKHSYIQKIAYNIPSFNSSSFSAGANAGLNLSIPLKWSWDLILLQFLAFRVFLILFFAVFLFRLKQPRERMQFSVHGLFYFLSFDTSLVSIVKEASKTKLVRARRDPQFQFPIIIIFNAPQQRTWNFFALTLTAILFLNFFLLNWNFHCLARSLSQNCNPNRHFDFN